MSVRPLSLALALARARADTAAQSLDGFQLDGHAIILKRSTRARHAEAAETPAGDGGGGERPGDGTKIVVKNVPFEATSREIRALFSSFGQVKRVRIPRKFDGSAWRALALARSLARWAAALTCCVVRSASRLRIRGLCE
jgi:hypothetical protein